MAGFVALPMGGGIKVQHIVKTFSRGGNQVIDFDEPVKDLSKTFFILNGGIAHSGSNLLLFPHFYNITNQSITVSLSGNDDSTVTLQVIEFI